MFINQKGSPFYIFRHCATFSERNFFSKISSFFPNKNVLRFLSLRYSADLRRSRLVLCLRTVRLRFLRVFLGPKLSHFQSTRSNFWLLTIERCPGAFQTSLGTVYKNRPLRGTRLFLLLYPFRSKKNDSQKNYFQDKREVSKNKK